MENSHEMDDITLLFCRFHALIDTVQGLMDELSIGLQSDKEGASSPEKDTKSYTVCASSPFDERRYKALIAVIDDALNRIEAAAVHPSPEPDRQSSLYSKEQIFTMEELLFLEKTFRSVYPLPEEGGCSGG